MYILYMYYVSEKMNQKNDKRKSKTKTVNENHKRKTKMINENSK